MKSDELRSSPEIRTGFIRGNGFGPKAVQYSVVDGLAIFEGDIVLGTVEEVERETAAVRAAAAGDGAEAEEAQVTERGVVISGPQYRWKGGTIPYTIDSGLANPSRVTDAMRHWRERTPIRFELRTAANAASYPDYVRFQDNGSGCNSQVGRRGGRQDINLGSGCSTGNAIHEIGHSVGLWHEQSREDRDTWVSIQWANIQSGFSHNFDQHISDGDDVGRYDYGSIMHYPPTAFSSNGQPTIVALQPIPPGVTMGQRTTLSATDIGAVRFMYPVRTQSGFLVQSNFGTKGNFEMVVARAGGGLAHYWRNNDAAGMPWSAAIPFGGTTNYEAVCLAQSNYGVPGNLEVMARTGNQLHFFWRDSGPSFTWHGPFPITTGVAGGPALIQSTFGTKGNFEMVVARAGGGLAHYWRNNDNPAMPWSAAIPFGGTASYGAVSLIQSNYGIPGNLEVMARTGNNVHFFWRDSGPSFTWHGPYVIV
ncbi:MAG TPA: Dot/Icm T4SS effector Zinc-dependent metalloprotease LegP [Actinomycetota bacterium]